MEGNKRQFEFNQSIDDLVSEAIDDPTNAGTHLKKAKYTIAGRQTLIKLAAKSDHGWATVSEYETNELAADEDDEKRIQSAEARAAKKIKKKQPTKRQRNTIKIGRPVRILSLLLLTIFFSWESDHRAGQRKLFLLWEVWPLERKLSSKTTTIPEQPQPTKLQQATNVITPKVMYDIHIEMLSENQCIYETYNTHVHIDKEYADYEQNQGDQPIKVSGRLKSHASFWSRIGTPDFILETIVNGYNPLLRFASSAGFKELE